MSVVIANSLALATNESMMDESIRHNAALFRDAYSELSPEEFTKALFNFSAELVAVTASRITHVFMTENEVSAMLDEVVEMMKLGKSIEDDFSATE